MSLKVYNVLTRKKEEFVTEENNQVKMYACGITVSDDAHIGHAYQAVVFDMIYRYLMYLGYEVNYVRNYTDVDDKIINRARDLGIDASDYAKQLIEKTDEELAQLGVKPPTVLAKATECISDMIAFIEKLIEKDYAYVSENGDVYFAVATFPHYGKFSNRTLEKNVAGTRKEIEPGKRDEHDFALWKITDDEMAWDSPWGRGRPGWHIECSAMSMKYLGATLDIHGGGEDLLFPHHENEIAQTEALTGKQFARYWIHNGLVNINGQKMSKSLGNSILLSELLEKYNRDVIRMTLLHNSYRSYLNIVDGMFEENEARIYRIYQLFNKIDKMVDTHNLSADAETLQKIDEEFKEAMNNDFNTPVVFANLFNYISRLEKLIADEEIVEAATLKECIIKVYDVLGILQQKPEKVITEIKDKYLAKNNINEEEIEKLIAKRQALKEKGEYNEADQVRTQLLNKGVVLRDTREKTYWDIVIK